MNELRAFYTNCAYEERMIKKEDVEIIEQNNVCDGASIKVYARLEDNSERWFAHFDLFYRDLWFDAASSLDNDELEFYIKFFVDVENKIAYNPFLVIGNNIYDDCIVADLTDKELKNLYDAFVEHNNDNNAPSFIGENKEKEEDNL